MDSQCHSRRWKVACQPRFDPSSVHTKWRRAIFKNSVPKYITKANIAATTKTRELPLCGAFYSELESCKKYTATVQLYGALHPLLEGFYF